MNSEHVIYLYATIFLFRRHHKPKAPEGQGQNSSVYQGSRSPQFPISPQWKGKCTILYRPTIHAYKQYI